jgi:hypothetical protein
MSSMWRSEESDARARPLEPSARAAVPDLSDIRAEVNQGASDLHVDGIGMESAGNVGAARLHVIFFLQFKV